METKEKTIGDYVAEDFRTAEVFKKYNIDFCCKGGRTLDEVSQHKQINKEKLHQELEAVKSKNPGAEVDFNSWPLDLLADYIEKTHHRYVEEKTQIIVPFLNKLSKVHGDRHPELLEIEKLFNDCAQEMAAHMKKEELILFPFIKKLMAAKSKGSPIESSHFGSVENPIVAMKHDHEEEGERFAKISALSNNYQFPDDACRTYQVTFRMLEDFEKDLHKHIHLENNILFPKSIELEKSLN